MTIRLHIYQSAYKVRWGRYGGPPHNPRALMSGGGRGWRGGKGQKWVREWCLLLTGMGMGGWAPGGVRLWGSCRRRCGGKGGGGWGVGGGQVENLLNLKIECAKWGRKRGGVKGSHTFLTIIFLRGWGQHVCMQLIRVEYLFDIVQHVSTLGWLSHLRFSIGQYSDALRVCATCQFEIHFRASRRLWVEPRRRRSRQACVWRICSKKY